MADLLRGHPIAVSRLHRHACSQFQGFLDWGLENLILEITKIILTLRNIVIFLEGGGSFLATCI